ncbi:MAG: hypothetical protein HFE75_02450 [Firmicutes bacterium]|nr:hypothetical protein [Bacillota bacterium]NBI62969.1 hypothetical protein [Clostridiales bacterium]
MRVSRYIISVLLVLIVLAFIGETHVWYLSEFEVRYPSVTFYPQKGVPQERMLSDISQAAERESVTVFVVEHEIESYISQQIDIYGTQETEAFLKRDAKIQEGVSHSLFLGDSTVSFHDLKEIPDVSKVSDYQTIGDAKQVLKFKQDLVNQYAGAFPEKGYQPFNSKLNVALAWSLAFALLLLLTVYHIGLMKKELLVRLVSGERISDFMLRQIVYDLGFYASVFVVAFLALKTLTNPFFEIGVSLTCVSVFLILNSLVYTWMLSIDVKKDNASYHSGKTLIAASHVYKGITMFVTVLVMSGSVTLIYDGIDCYKQKRFFQEHKEDSYVMLSSFSDTDDKEADLRDKIYGKSVERNKTCMLVELLGFEHDDDNYVYADRGAIPYLRQQIPELRGVDLCDTAYIIKPENVDLSGNEFDEAEELFRVYSQDEDTPIRTITYQRKTEIIAHKIGDGVVSRLKENPIIILNNMKPKFVDGYLWTGTMVNLTDSEWEGYLKQNGFTDEIAYRTNVYENYLHSWRMLKWGMVLGIVLLAIMFVMECFILYTTLYYEYRLNAMELSLQKVLGFTIFQRHRKIGGLTIASGVGGLVIAILIGSFLDIGNLIALVIAGFAIIAFELAFILRYAFKLETINVQRVLKGGYL